MYFKCTPKGRVYEFENSIRYINLNLDAPYYLIDGIKFTDVAILNKFETGAWLKCDSDGNLED